MRCTKTLQSLNAQLKCSLLNFLCLHFPSAVSSIHMNSISTCPCFTISCLQHSQAYALNSQLIYPTDYSISSFGNLQDNTNTSLKSNSLAFPQPQLSTQVSPALNSVSSITIIQILKAKTRCYLCWFSPYPLYPDQLVYLISALKFLHLCLSTPPFYSK